ncbi:metallophosphoesterase [Paenibacillus sp. SYP-B3998]|uniref:Metallophosphoesterase n=1 Tax=Paenibacillus sp. SYP-B3998 TaxID=2678564 RepID=A0A6G3ZWP3_9BACL|nr:metallophosphoesterase [Paenibacillus sp. SYP-B3998]NEW06552.1 metallophosphoesterase [Paenibacillus sp. SYP-B3998]
MQQSPPLSRRSFLKKGVVLAGSALASGGLVGSYSTLVEPRWYEITKVNILLERLPGAFHGKKLVHISDFHIGHHFDLKQLQVVTNLVRQEKPDLLCFTGDLFDSKVTEDPQLTSDILASLEVPLGKWSVLGNHDYDVSNEKTAAILQNGGFQTLSNSYRTIRHAGQTIQIAGVEDMLTGAPDLDEALRGTNADAFTLLLSHSPNFADYAAERPIDLQLSGHSHGGQIRLPVIGALVTPPLGDKYVMGLHSVPGYKLQVYTTRGIGTTIFPLRFMCRPEITVITLEKTKP